MPEAILVLITAVVCFVLGAWVNHRSRTGVSPVPTLPIFADKAEVVGGEPGEENKIIQPERAKL